MKKFRYVLLILLLLIIAVVLSGCISLDKVIHIDETEETAMYYLYRVNSSMKYLQFLENFDYEKYEIFDISISAVGDAGSENAILYSITYRRK